MASAFQDLSSAFLPRSSAVGVRQLVEEYMQRAVALSTQIESSRQRLASLEEEFRLVLGAINDLQRWLSPQVTGPCPLAVT